MMSFGMEIYEWNAWDGYMLPKLLPEAARVAADPGDSPSDLAAKFSPGIDVVAFHLNCSITSRFPPCRDLFVRMLHEQGTLTLNAGVTDLTKRTLQETLRLAGLPSVGTARGQGAPDEKLIVKTNLNYGAEAERKLSPSQRQHLNLPPISSSIKSSKRYRVVPRRKIPDAWWDWQSLAIERYVDNKEDQIMRVYFAGRHVFAVTLESERAIKKFSSGRIVRESLSDLDTFSRAAHPALPQAFQREFISLISHLKIDFGAIDAITAGDGTTYIIDVNATSYGRALHAQALEHLRAGLVATILEQHPDLAGKGLILGNSRIKGANSSGRPDAVGHAREDRGSEQGTGHQPNKPLPEATPLSPEGKGLTSVEPATWYHNPGDLFVVLCTFNAASSRTKVRNLNLCTSILRMGKVPMLIIDCAMGQERWAIPSAPDVWRLRSTNGHLWQKERLLNCALERVPKRFFQNCLDRCGYFVFQFRLAHGSFHAFG